MSFRRQALQTWVSKRGKQATYRNLITAFYNAKCLDFCQVVIDTLELDMEGQLLPPLNVKSVERVLKDVTRWNDLGLYLGVTRYEIDEISKKYGGEGMLSYTMDPRYSKLR